ncbi:MAG: carboxylating nicotinate-nucleotide diphosphorylase [Alphaproteobacteria bacterium]|nr:carboxylating nicotinate-nucleotide diphosphorylase [Alphaproteobacteria bacterium]MBV9062404.1 carboxylating nicotinate-nucleotide diphosphorylase [Alphaproteobacteria bacterium]
MSLALPFTRAPEAALVEPIVRRALEEDLGRGGDITSALIIPDDRQITARLVARKAGTVAGLIAAECAFRLVDSSISFQCELPDGSPCATGSEIAHIAGPARAILTAERVALNFVGHLSGIATATHALVSAVKGTKAKIVDTRKTTPGLRLLEKYAVRCGGGFNHRSGLDDAILIKDNHIAVAGSITEAVRRARVGVAHMMKIEVEVDTLPQLEEALLVGVDTILLDNMSVDDLRRAVALNRGRALLEASGGVTLGSVRGIAETGVDYISSGAITHSAPSLDVGLDL